LSQFICYCYFCVGNENNNNKRHQISDEKSCLKIWRQALSYKIHLEKWYMHKYTVRAWLWIVACWHCKHYFELIHCNNSDEKWTSHAADFNTYRKWRIFYCCLHICTGRKLINVLSRLKLFPWRKGEFFAKKWNGRNYCCVSTLSMMLIFSIQILYSWLVNRLTS